ncbi:nuclear shuttle protein [Asystasia mosaic Madagascar virus]|uniref:Nuclear shuttle protein n=1 Tax=Asystasia mosaic Madagascar virus TaxID=1611435 RepID=A0A0C5B7Q8_9GEMI|nr:nuclear shuttle protein [Asystasia mosaic Madagascar virus]AJM13608.1 nuclear shuttle protein [Asystasia mosaic Madagascar virus]
MYSSARRSVRTPYRAFSVRKTARKSVAFSSTKPPVNRALSYESSKKTYVSRTIEDVHSGQSLQLSQQSDYTSFVSFPSLSHDGSFGRSFDHIKLMSIRVSGTIQVSCVNSDDPMGVSPQFNGIFMLSIICDKRPFVPDGVTTLPKFQELFGSYESVYGSPRLKDNVRHRYRLLGHVKKYISSDKTHVQVPFFFRRRISSRKYPIWSSFKDPESSQTGGNYKNISKNALIISCVWVSVQNSNCSVYSQNVLHYVG